MVGCALLGSCAGITETECRTMDWEKRGHDDAMLYAVAPQVDEYTARCQAFGVTPDARAYMDGWRDGYAEKDASM